ncbi:tyrosine-type recombinase/integrase [Eubacterium aggregans]|uniref:tyrosine-type recombinase/integrase n=1 Tax=Eubacterium aggregans TaxID=81409 RepID=UPI003F404EFB
MLLSKWLMIYLEDYAKIKVKTSTSQKYERDIRNHLIPNLGNIRLSALHPHQIQSLYNQLAIDHSAKSIANVHGILHKDLEQAIQLGYLTSNPANVTQRQKPQRPEIKPLDTEEIKLVLDTIKDYRFEYFYITPLFSGMRLSEGIGLTWDCIDFEDGSVHLYRQLQFHKKGIGYQWETLKNNRPHTIYPPQLVMNTLRKVQLQQREWRLRAGSVWENDENFIFTNEIGAPLIHVTVRKYFKLAMNSIGLDTVRFHDLRHTFATLALNAGDDIKSVQQMLGHHSAAYTMNTYAHSTNEMQKKSAQCIENFISVNIKE